MAVVGQETDERPNVDGHIICTCGLEATRRPNQRVRV